MKPLNTSGQEFNEESILLPELTPELARPRRSQWQMILERFLSHRIAAIAAVFLIILILFCFVGPFITGHNQPDEIGLTEPFAAPSLAYPFGGDDVGRDSLARAMAGGQVSLLVGILSMLVAIILGIGVGALAGFFGGIIDNILMRITDTLLAIPLYLLLFMFSALFINGTAWSVILLISFFGWTTTARLVRGEFLAHREREYVQSARSIGARSTRLMFRHILPNVAGPIIVNATLLIGNNIILEAVLSYFGFGIRIPTASWGNMIQVGQGVFDSAPLLTIIPGVLIFLTVLSCNLVGDGLRDALDPQMSER